jgi:phage shock protein E
MSTKKKGLLGRVFALFAGSGGSSPDIRIKAEQAQELIKAQPNLVILDVRTPAEYAAGHLTGARLLNFFDAQFKDEIQQLDRAASYLIYCRSGNRSGKAARLMLQWGFTELYELQGGHRKLARCRWKP